MDRDPTDRLSRLLVEFFERFSSWEHAVVRGSGLTLPQMHTLEILGDGGAMRMKELAGRMGVTTGTLTVLVDRLETRGLVRRKPNDQDRRSVLVELTDAGRRHFEQHHALHRCLTQELGAGLAEADQAKLAELLEAMLARF
ncbi:MAG: MarR family winged helix-turn-helix transcriptional regulator [Desulfovibrionaceae bacterium]